MKKYFLLLMNCPELLIFPVNQQFVKFILRNSVLKGQALKDQGEKADPQSKDIGFDRVISQFFILMAAIDLGSHVSLLSTYILIKGQSFIVLYTKGCEPKVTQLRTHTILIFKDEHVFQFEVAMDDVLGMEVVYCFGHLLKNLPQFINGDRLLLEVVNEGALGCMFQDQNTIRLSQLMFDGITLKSNIFLVLEGLDDVLVLEGGQNLKFIFEVPLFFLEARRYHLDNNLVVTLSEDIYIGVAATTYLLQLVLMHYTHKLTQK